VKHWNEPLRWNKALKNQWVCDCGFDENYVTQPVTCPGCKVGVPRQKRERVFCASMADVFEGRVDLQPERERLWKLIEGTPNLDWLLLTKRPENVMDTIPMEWVMHGLPLNVWMGVTAENQVEANSRLPILLTIPAKVRFLSCEPLLGPLSLEAMQLDPHDSLFRYWPLEGKHIGDGMNEARAHADAARIHWVICGGESGPQARAMNPDWARGLRDQCVSAGVTFLFKQWGEWRHCDEMPPCDYADAIRRDCCHQNGPGNGYLRVGKKAAGRLLDGREWNGFPVVS